MTAITNDKHFDFHWTPVTLGLSILLGFLATVGVWLFSGLLIMLFLS